MSVFWPRRAASEKRSVFPSMPLSSLIMSSSFSDVNLSQAESSLQKVAVWSAVDLIASLASELPLDVFRGQGKDRVPLSTPSYLLDPSGDGYGVEDWTAQLVTSWLLRGNGYGRKLAFNERGGFPTQIQLFHPDTVSGRPNGDGGVDWTANGQSVPEREMWHRRVYPTPGQLVGMSPVEKHASTIGLGISATRYGVQWFRDGAHPSGMLTNDEVELDKPAADTAKERFLAALHGTREPVVMGKGWKYQSIQVAANESQFLETNNYTAAECARIFGPGVAEILGYDTGGSMTYANVESRNVHLLVYAVNKWFRRLERVYASMLPRPQYARLNRAAMLQSTTLDRYRAHELALRNRWKVVDEVRDDEELQPVPWGKQPNPISGAQPAIANPDQQEE